MTNQLAAPARGSAAPPPTGTPPVADDIARVAPALSDARELLKAPVSGATWRAVAQSVIGFPWLLLVFVVAVTALSLVPGLVVLFGLGLLILVGTLLAARGFATAERARLRAQLGVDIEAPVKNAPRQGSWGRRFVGVVGNGRLWAHTGYALVGWFLVTIEWVAGIGLLGWGLGTIAYPLVARAAHLDVPNLYPLYLVLAIVLLWVAALALQAVTLGHVRLARAWLGKSRRQADEERMRAEQERTAAAEARAVQLAETRTAAVGAADDERRRIERDLHDGAQQRLVALGVELGVARRNADTDPEAAAAALEHAHREVKETLAELRDLVRGIHPAVLTDRGLDAALSALAARSPIPVTVDAGPGLDRASATAQAAAYFVAAEALTNAAKYAEARSIRVTARVLDGTGAPWLRLVVEDDGRGGASATPGSGLDGLQARVAALDGTFSLVSPAGRGTRVSVEVPCAS
jgi:signal transduction histidine kinase